MKQQLHKLVVSAMLTALAVVLIATIHFPLMPAAPFLIYDPGDIAILIGAFAYGPVVGLMITLVASAIQALTLSSDGLYGFVMHVIATGTLVLVSASIYRIRHTRAGAVLGLLSGTVAMTVMMMIANHFITPFYLQMPVEAVDGMLLPIIAPFNLMKAGINSVGTFVVYKAVSKHIIHAKPMVSSRKLAEEQG